MSSSGQTVCEPHDAAVVPNRLLSLHALIARRCATTVEQNPEWPCRRGCDECCRRLAFVPRVSAAEAELLRQAIDGLPAATQARIRERAASLHPETGGPVVCPLLDQVSGACLVYQHRPLACRTYGFYVERGVGLYCENILAGVEAGRYADVLWGNQESIDEAARALGPEVRLIDVLAPGRRA